MPSHSYSYLSAFLIFVSVPLPVVSYLNLISRPTNVPLSSRRTLPVMASSFDDSSSQLLEHADVIIGVQKYGTPVGVAILPNKDIQAFHLACREALPHLKRIHYRGAEPHISKDSGFKQIHVQTEVAAAIVDGNTHLIDFIRDCGGEFMPGVRRTKECRRRRSSGRHLKREDDDDNGNVAENGNVKLISQKNISDSSSTGSASDSVGEIEQSPKFTFVELFAGIGGFRLGLEKIGGSCVLASERDEVACRVYRRQFGADDLVEGDMLDIVSDDFPLNGFDILTAGFPCQPFSLRGEQKGLDDDGHRGQMYQELVRVLMEQRPKYFLFENVVGLVTMEGGSASHWTGEHIFKPGKVMDRMLEAFRKCGYKVEWHVVNSKYFVPQYRERVYFFGSLLELECPDMNWKSIYPPADRKPPALREFLEKDYATSDTVVGCELSVRQWDMIQEKYDEAARTARLKIEEYSPTLISSYRTAGSPSTRFVMEEADGTLRNGNPLRPRFLSPRECCHIMGFPDDFDISAPYKGEIGHIYQVLGNAVVPPVIEAIGREILRLMEQVKTKKDQRKE